MTVRLDTFPNFPTLVVLSLSDLPRNGWGRCQRELTPGVTLADWEKKATRGDGGTHVVFVFIGMLAVEERMQESCRMRGANASAILQQKIRTMIEGGMEPSMNVELEGFFLPPGLMSICEGPSCGVDFPAKIPLATR